jgi:hypothetical protein
VSHVMYKLGFYDPEGDILHSKQNCYDVSGRSTVNCKTSGWLIGPTNYFAYTTCYRLCGIGGQSSWLEIQRSRVCFWSLEDFLTISGSGSGSIQPRVN